MKTIKGPGIFLAQFIGKDPPFDRLETIADWAAKLGYVGVQLPTNTPLFDLALAAESRDYCQQILLGTPKRKSAKAEPVSVPRILKVPLKVALGCSFT